MRIVDSGSNDTHTEKSATPNRLDKLRQRQSVPCCPDETWKQVSGHEEYTVSTCGRFRRNGKPRAVSISPRGYAVVGMSGKTHSLHTLVLETFVGPRPRGQCGCHYDGVQANNHLSNLRWDTFRNNFKDRDRHGTTSRGEHRWSAILREKDIPKICELRKRGHTQSEIAAEFGVSQATITRVLTGESWSHVPRPQ